MLTVIERARRYLAKCPSSISGQHGHGTAFRVAAVLVNGFGLSALDALALLREWNARCQPPWSEAELLHKVKSVANAQHRDRRGHLLGDRAAASPRPYPHPERMPAQQVAKPEFRPMVLKRIAAKAAVADVVAFIGERSPVRVDTQDSASVLRRLYPLCSGEKVLIFSDMRSQGQMLWEADKSTFIQNRHLPTGSDGIWFLPQPVDGEFHANLRLNGKRSRRSEESVRAWRYVVLESDEADSEDWLRCLIQMPLRIVSICESGGRSIHALVRLDAASKEDWDSKVRKMKPALVTLGADPGALSAVRLTRLPQAKRGVRVQRLLYLAPTPAGEPIYGREKEAR
jgi:hypothetical protein